MRTPERWNAGAPERWIRTLVLEPIGSAERGGSAGCGVGREI